MTNPARTIVAQALSEGAWQALVIDLAHVHGWFTFHPYDSRRSTPGWPDLTLIRGRELVFAELKRFNGKVTPDQAHVIELLEDAGQEVHVWRPQDEVEVRERLARRQAAHAR